ncbi:MAG: tRNA (N(6)-L-threonylcarbamoyladenosine(37)-C(2))-methylthiotransferase MtaB [Desulfobacterales bacterium]|uniref:tRNA (N(6)-L-threonylcarbamoyladenosine(37)-C(2))-methylthiotransferase MtaB n=1 Tax=Candidatus Desulfaltia bathyphila TaxID=2841697 RepID=A0A8J6N794_9BACT|nr:tRNA (N(6)-L-threonylcarbamoyladenosine(37)-C(2))-methylthiotransferase MtaB [Candidatus Desulfaltia bathyphila]MBL7194863.1 tRNA (N(6)-L-threonylcarbamoyladenosine(37)-C(2))-methylthiotransferase MtaB [Desulfobacterales bacterium]MBL7207526.1 tRNA (N(6)-L-threonylcarbamoyladenosine(37)-C(2))-methylthiotransferase MtaB [Desulfobacterales bacterium]
MPIFNFTTLGCKVNQYESEAIAQSLAENGWNAARSKENADLCIINTCAVTQKASMQSRQAVRKAIRSNPNACIVVTGCYAQVEPDEIKKINGVHYIIGHADKHKIPEIIIDGKEQDSPTPEFYQLTIRHDIKHEHKFQPTLVMGASGNRTRPLLKIQDGCDNFCTYCIVPYARGRSRSMRPEMVLENIKQISRSGCHEVVLSGIHLGRYGIDLLPETSLAGLLKSIHEARIIKRVRLSSIEPDELNDDIIKIVAESDIFCHHFHTPLQSGDDLILKRMHRHYSLSFFRDMVIKIHEMIPDAAIGVDVLIGFPGETEKAFENTYSLIEQLPVTYLHVFPFSGRKGTPANSYPDKVPPQVIKDRCLKMRKIGTNKKVKFYKKLVGEKVELLIEGARSRATGYLKGTTSNYVPVLVSGKDNLKNCIVQARINELCGSSAVLGRIS